MIANAARAGRVGGLSLLLCLSVIAPARAYEDQLTLGIAGGYAAALSEDIPTHAVLADASLGVGLTQAWSIRLRVGYGAHPAEPTVHMLLPGAALLYAIDVLEWVPYFGLGAGAIGRFVAGDSSLDATAAAIGGIDYLLSRELTLELELRAHLLLSDLERSPLLLSSTIGVVFMFDAG